jgi:hypothetical protein
LMSEVESSVVKADGLQVALSASLFSFLFWPSFY